MSSSTSAVATIPLAEESPHSSATSLPARSERVTPTPTSSKTGWSTISAITIDPTTPVPQTTTRFLSMFILWLRGFEAQDFVLGTSTTAPSSVEGGADPGLGEAVVLERVRVRGLRVALLGLLVDLLDRRLHLGGPVQPELVVDAPGHAERVGHQVLEGDVDELVLVVRRARVVEGVEGARPQVQLGVADHAADVRRAVAD